MSEVGALLVETAQRIFAAGGAQRAEALREAGLDRPFAGGSGLAWSDLEGVVRASARAGADAAAADTIAVDHLLARCGISHDRPVALGVGTLALAADGTVSGRARGVTSAGLVAASAHGAGHRLVLLDPAAAVVRAGHNVADEARLDMEWHAARPVADAALPAGDHDAPLLEGALSRSLLIAGALERILGMTVEHCRTRTQFGRPLAAFQAIQHALAQLAEESAAATAISRRAAACMDGPFAPLAVAAAKLRTAEAARRAVDIAHQCHGAIGFTAEYPLQVSTRSLLAWRAEFEGPAFWAERLGAAVRAAGRPVFAQAVALREGAAA